MNSTTTPEPLQILYSQLFTRNSLYSLGHMILRKTETDRHIYIETHMYVYVYMYRYTTHIYIRHVPI